MPAINAPQMSDLMDVFPAIELPCILSADSLLEISKHSKAPNRHVLDRFIHSWLPPKEFSEVLPVALLHHTENYRLFALWELDLTESLCYIFTLDREGELVSKEVVAGQSFDSEGRIHRQVAIVDEDVFVHSKQSWEGGQEDLEDLIEKGSYTFEVTPEGFIARL